MSLHTARLVPFRVDRVGGSYTIPSYLINPDALLSETNDEVCEVAFIPGSDPFRYASLLFSAEIPSFGAIREGRLISRAKLDSEEFPSAGVRLYELHYLRDGVRTGFRTDTTSNHSTGDFSVMETPFTSLGNRIVSFLNDNRGHRAEFELRFQFFLHGSPSSWDTEPHLLLDWVAIELDYELPEFPWRATLQLQGEGAPQKIKQGSNAPNMQFAVTDGEGNPLDLRGAEVKLVATSRQVCCFGGPVTMVDAEKGLCLYEWKPGDTAQPGEFSLELVTDWADGTRVIIPHDDYFRIQIVPALKPELAP